MLRYTIGYAPYITFDVWKCLIFLYYLLLLICTCVLISQCMCAIRKATLGVTSLLLPCGPQGLDSGHQTWPQVPVPAKPAYWPPSMHVLFYDFVKVFCKWVLKHSSYSMRDLAVVGGQVSPPWELAASAHFQGCVSLEVCS